MPVRPHEVLRGMVHTEACECLASFVYQRTGFRTATETQDSQQAVATRRVVREALNVKRLPVATQHQRQTWTDHRFLEPDGLPVKR